MQNKTKVELAELIGGPFDGLQINKSDNNWAQFIDLGISGHKDSRRALYRFEPLASGALQYQFDRRYNRAT